MRNILNNVVDAFCLSFKQFRNMYFVLYIR